MKTAIIGFEGFELTYRVKGKLKLALRDVVKNYGGDDFLLETKGELYEFVKKNAVHTKRYSGFFKLQTCWAELP